MAAPVAKKTGAPPKGDRARPLDRAQNYSRDEWERVEWAAAELGLLPATFVRMAALKEAKQVLG
jgi:hypothetical protein